MWKRVSILVAVLGAVFWSTAQAQSISDLLEKGIYTEQTVGDLDAAIEIYEKIVAEHKANKSLAAQAQFRMGQCLLRQGKKKAAIEAFESLIKEFPDEKDLVTEARKEIPAKDDGLPLGPIPWQDGEVLQLRLKMAGGLDIGTIVWTADTAKRDGQDIWRFHTYRYTTLNGSQGVSQADADRKTFRPVFSSFKHSLMGTTEAEYSPSRVKISSVDKDGKKKEWTAGLNSVVYDNEQGLYLFRRLPIKEGYKVTTPIYVTFGGGLVPIELDVQAKETIKVPAGEFECYKTKLSLVQQTFWFTTDANRYLVRFDAGGVTAELESIQQIKPGQPNQYIRAAGKGASSVPGFTLTAPHGWLFHEETANLLKKEGSVTVCILDPEAIALSSLGFADFSQLTDEEKASARVWAEGRIQETKSKLKDYEVRSSSWAETTVSGRPAVRYIADYMEGEQEMVDVNTVLFGDSGVFRFRTHLPKSESDAFLKQFDGIVASFRIK